MKFKIPNTIEDIRLLSISAAVNYGEEEIPNDFPGREGDVWNAEIDLDSRKLLNWPAGRVEKIHLTVKDCGSYSLISNSGRVVLSLDQEYVPHGVVPGKYGDTIELDIAADGTVKNWPRIPDISAFINLPA